MQHLFYVTARPLLKSCLNFNMPLSDPAIEKNKYLCVYHNIYVIVFKEYSFACIRDQDTTK